MSVGSYFAESFQYGDAGREIGSSDTAPAVLRARILLHLLFTDRLVIPDSQILNNVALRGLLWPQAQTSAAPSDLGDMVTDGRLVIARRDIRPSLTELRAWQASRGSVMPNVPTEEYTRYVDALLDRLPADHVLTWNFDQVRTGYKTSALRLLRRHGEDLGQQDRATDVAIDWVESQETLLYSEFLEWKRSVARVLDPVALTQVDHLVAAAYQLNFASTNDLDMAGPDDKSSPFGHVRLDDEQIAHETTADCYAINGFVLSRVPVPVILAAIESRPRQAILAEFDKARLGAVPEWHTVENAFQELMEKLNIAVLKLLDSTDLAKAREVFHEVRPKVRLRWVAHRAIGRVMDALLEVSTGGTPVTPVTMGAKLSLLGWAVYRDVHQERRDSVLEATHQWDREAMRLLQTHPDQLLVRFPTTTLQRVVAAPGRLEAETVSSPLA
ncbi:MAG TPA: hypothetical protein VH561_11030 [Micromonosporaceae bacterium]